MIIGNIFNSETLAAGRTIDTLVPLLISIIEILFSDVLKNIGRYIGYLDYIIINNRFPGPLGISPKKSKNRI